MFSRRVIADLRFLLQHKYLKVMLQKAFVKGCHKKDQSNFMSVFLFSGGVNSVVIKLTFSKNDMKSGCVYLPSY